MFLYLVYEVSYYEDQSNVRIFNDRSEALNCCHESLEECYIVEYEMIENDFGNLQSKT